MFLMFSPLSGTIFHGIHNNFEIMFLIYEFMDLVSRYLDLLVKTSRCLKCKGRQLYRGQQDNI
jgi:hypothetical protein